MTNKTVILFKGSACAPCKQFEPFFDKVMEEFPDYEVDKRVDDVESMRQYGLRAIPSVVIWNNSDHVVVPTPVKISVLKELLA